MTQTTNRFLDEFFQADEWVAGAADGLRKEAEAIVQVAGRALPA